MGKGAYRGSLDSFATHPSTVHSCTHRPSIHQLTHSALDPSTHRTLPSQLEQDEAIIRTFRGVSRHFADVFKELVPNGHGACVYVYVGVSVGGCIYGCVLRVGVDVFRYVGVGVWVSLFVRDC